MSRRPSIKAGDRFERLVAVEEIGFDNQRKRTWKFVCDCGTEVITAVYRVKARRALSCGCLSRELRRAENPKHGLSRLFRDEYFIWYDIRRRCLDPERPAYKDYGGRGITVCDPWLDDFAAFIEDMGPRPSPDHSIDRVDNDGGYSPENCRWATDAEQRSNTRKTRTVEYRGRRLTLEAMCREEGVAYHTIWARLERGWTVERAFSVPIPTYRRVERTVEYRGEQVSLKALCRNTEMSYDTVGSRLRRGWNIEDALTKPLKWGRKKGSKIKR